MVRKLTSNKRRNQGVLDRGQPLKRRRLPLPIILIDKNNGLRNEVESTTNIRQILTAIRCQICGKQFPSSHALWGHQGKKCSRTNRYKQGMNVFIVEDNIIDDNYFNFQSSIHGTQVLEDNLEDDGDLSDYVKFLY